jgi:biotin carboxyl carrier protein
MPGLVSAVMVKEGETVERGQVLAVLESMKMQMQMRAPISGRITRVAVKPAGQVEKGTLIVQID